MKKLSYLVLFFLLAIPASAQNQFKLSSIPFLLSWHNMSKSFQMTDINKRISTIPHNLIIRRRSCFSNGINGSNTCLYT